MSKQKLLTSWYGHDQESPTVDSRYTTVQLGIEQVGMYNRPGQFVMSDEAASRFTEIEQKFRQAAAMAYYAPCDGYTDNDYIEWAKSLKQAQSQYYYDRWRAQKALGLNSHFTEYKFSSIITDFFSSYSKRTDRIFRMIELNEFAHRGADKQTFEDFLLTDEKYAKACRSMSLLNYSKISEDLYKTDVKFLEFGTKVGAKTKDLLLALNREEMVKVLDYEANPFYSKSRSDTYTYQYAKLFIEAAIVGAERLTITDLTSAQVSEEIFKRLLSTQRHFWESISRNHSLSHVLSLIKDEFDKCSTNNESFQRNFAYFVKSGALEELSPKDLVAVVLGFDKPHRWIENSKSKTSIEIITEMVHAKKVSADQIIRLIAFIIINNKQPIAVPSDFEWGDMTDMPDQWMYEMIPKSNKKVTLQHPSIFGYLS